jgi:hypothetical protein
LADRNVCPTGLYEVEDFNGECDRMNPAAECDREIRRAHDSAVSWKVCPGIFGIRAGALLPDGNGVGTRGQGCLRYGRVRDVQVWNGVVGNWLRYLPLLRVCVTSAPPSRGGGFIVRMVQWWGRVWLHRSLTLATLRVGVRSVQNFAGWKLALSALGLRWGLAPRLAA